MQCPCWPPTNNKLWPRPKTLTLLEWHQAQLLQSPCHGSVVLQSCIKSQTNWAQAHHDTEGLAALRQLRQMVSNSTKKQNSVDFFATDESNTEKLASCCTKFQWTWNTQARKLLGSSSGLNNKKNNNKKTHNLIMSEKQQKDNHKT